MEIGILGLPQSGKSTLFEIMTGVRSMEMHGETCIRGLAAVPDVRFDRLVEIFRPERVSPAKVPFSDVNAVGEKAWNTIRQSLSGAEGLLHVVDAFTAAGVAEIQGRYRKLADELILADLMIVENRLERLAKMAKKPMTPQDILHAQVLPRLKTQLEGGKPLRDIPLTEEERHGGIRSFSFWTIRPELVVVNTPEANPAIADAFTKDAGLSAPVIGICCAIEAELLALPPEERKEFLDSLGIAEAAFGRVILSFALLGRIAFFTVGDDEVKAWIVPAGCKAPKAAGAIHDDFERGFIKAEVISYEEFIACGGTHAGAKAAGKLRLEGKEYIVRDGDIINFRFNV